MTRNGKELRYNLAPHPQYGRRKSALYLSFVPIAMFLFVATGIFVWYRFGFYKIRSELAELGLTVTLTAQGATAEKNSNLTAKRFLLTGPLLANLPALQKLNLSGTKINDLEPLKGLSTLQSLDLSGTEIDNLEPLKGLSALQSLNLSYTNVADLDPLKDLSALRHLLLSETPVDNLEPLKDLSELRYLDLSYQALLISTRSSGSPCFGNSI